MPTLNILHLTDLHLGMTGLLDLWPNVEQDFLEDLGYVLEKTGSLDLVLFTGDLVQRGSPSEFTQVDVLLQRVWNHFQRMGVAPKLLAVPGNHDLVRPDSSRAAWLTLQHLWHLPEVQNLVWNESGSEQRKLISDAFENYNSWWATTLLPKPESYNPGLLPGDFSATIEKEGFRFGFVGLNTSFLQLTGGDLHGKLGLSVRQFHVACNGNGPSWTSQHDLSVLITHHPPDWLTQQSQEQLNSEIHNPPSRFALHLHGHMHDSKLRATAEGGAEARRRLQGCSLFGMEGWGASDTPRLHGYSLCQLKTDGSNAELVIWPRRAEKKQGGGWRIDRDLTFSLPKGGDFTQPVALTLPNPVARKITTAAPPLSPPTSVPENDRRRAVKELERLHRQLQDGTIVFKSQRDQGLRLEASLRTRFGAEVPRGRGFSDIFAMFYDRYDNSQRELHKLIRGLTINAMYPANQAHRQWLADWDSQTLLTNSSPAILSWTRQLTQLRQHLFEWFNKYEVLFKNDERIAVVYLGDESGHGVPFPTDLERTTTIVLRELQIQGE